MKLLERKPKYSMELNKIDKAEFVDLGFIFIDEVTATGRIPASGDISGWFIEVEISLNGYPLKGPKIQLLSIKGNNSLYKCIPRRWRHLDEQFMSGDPKQSNFYVCCLHNWSAKQDYNGSFIYSRLIDWLECNVKEQWRSDDDLISWRIIPQITNGIVYLSNEFLLEYSKIDALEIFNCTFEHSQYEIMKKGAKSKSGTDFAYNSITFPEAFVKPYFYFEDRDIDQNHRLQKNIVLRDGSLKSVFNVIRLPRHFSFKTMYQLTQTLLLNTRVEELPATSNIPLMVMYEGDRGRTEVVSFLTSKEYINGDYIKQLKLIHVEVLPDTPLGVDLNVGIIGGGALGSQVSKMLAHKKTKTIFISDFDQLSMDNIGNHELDIWSLGELKAKALKAYLKNIHLQPTYFDIIDSPKMFEESDLLVVTVGNKNSYDSLAFDRLRTYSKPIIWAWTSPNNILQEIVITSPFTGCLNCYYKLIQENTELKSLHQRADEEIQKDQSVRYDYCGNPHVISQWEKLSFLAGQIVTILSLYSKSKSFKYDHYNYYWGKDEIMPSPVFGYLNQNATCFCRGANN